MCSLLNNLFHFNYRTNIISVVASLMINKNEMVSQICFQFAVHLFHPTAIEDPPLPPNGKIRVFHSLVSSWVAEVTLPLLIVTVEDPPLPPNNGIYLCHPTVGDSLLPPELWITHRFHINWKTHLFNPNCRRPPTSSLPPNWKTHQLHPNWGRLNFS